MALGDIFYEDNNGVMHPMQLTPYPSYSTNTSTGSVPWQYPIATNKTTPLYRIDEGYDSALEQAAQNGQIPQRYRGLNKKGKVKNDPIIIDSMPQVNYNYADLISNLEKDKTKLISENQKLKQEIEDLKQQLKSLCENGTKPQIIETEELEKLFE